MVVLGFLVAVASLVAVLSVGVAIVGKRGNKIKIKSNFFMAFEYVAMCLTNNTKVLLSTASIQY